MSPVGFKILLCVFIFVAITAREIDRETEFSDEKDNRIFKENFESLQTTEDTDVTTVNSTEIPCTRSCTNGKCVVTEYGEQICQCPTEYGLYSSSQCNACKCGEDSNCTFNYFGTKTCICKKGYAESSGVCEKCYCGPNAGCRFENSRQSGAYGQKTCFCLEGYKNVDGKCKDPCSPNPCQNGGRCKRIEGNFDCTCKFPYSGKMCETACECINGVCLPDEYGNAVCQCPPESGLYLNKICKACECGGGGSCEFTGPEATKTCYCKEGYKRVMDICKECYCGPFSSCYFENQDSKRCICPDGQMDIYGICKDPCNPNPCENGGTCSFFNGNYSCICRSPYSGRMCEIECSCGRNGQCYLDEIGNKKCYCSRGFKEFGGICKECYCGPNSACFFNKNGDMKCAGENGGVDINGKSGDERKESIAVPALLGAILITILFGFLIFTCALWRRMGHSGSPASLTRSAEMTVR